MGKICFKCNEMKDISEFYKHPQMADGHVNKCKECNKSDVRKNRKSNIDHYREYDRVRGNRQSKSYLQEYRGKYPRKYTAQTMINNAIRSGVIVRPKYCSSCGSDEFVMHGHHDNYKYPMIVRWLCPACHKEWHDINGEAPNGG